jgi:hypothetical protein
MHPPRTAAPSIFSWAIFSWATSSWVISALSVAALSLAGTTFAIPGIAHAAGEAAEEAAEETAEATRHARATQAEDLSKSALELARRRMGDGEGFTLIVTQPKKGSRKKPSVTVMVGEPQPLPAMPAPTATATRGRDVLDETGPGDPIRSLIDIALGPSVMTRSFDFSPSPANTPNLRSYKLPGMAMMEAAVDVYPAVGVDLPLVRDLGLSGHYGHSIDMLSTTADGRTFLSHSHRWHLALCYRYRTGAEQRLRLNGKFAYGQQQFALVAEDTRAEQIAAQAPSVDYQFIKFHAQGGYAFDPLTFWIGVAYLRPLEGGEIYQRFRKPKLNGIDLDARIDVTMGAGFGLRLAGDYRRVFSRFTPIPGDSYVAGGALEQIITTHAAIRYVH